MKEPLHVGIWSHRDMRVLVPAKAATAAVVSLTLTTLILRAHDSGHGPLALTGLFIAMALPMMLTVSLAGQVADRHDSRRVLVIGHVVSVLATGALALAHQLWAIYALVVVAELGTAFTAPVWTALVPRIVGVELVGRAMAWQQGLAAACAPIGGALAGVAYGLGRDTEALLGAAALLGVMVVASLVVRTRRGGARDLQLAAAQAEHPHGGFALIRRDGVLLTLFVAILAISLFLEGANVVEVFLARDALGASPMEYGFSELCFGAGSILGAVVAGRVATDRWRGLGGLLAFAGVGALVLGAGLAPTFGVYLGIAVVLGLAAAAGNALIGAFLMTRTPDARRGSVSAAVNGASRVMSVIALVAGGLAGTWLGPRATFVTFGAATCLVIGLCAVLLARSMVHAAPTPPNVARVNGRD